MFYFQSMFQQVYSGITGSTVLPAVQQVAEAILLPRTRWPLRPAQCSALSRLVHRIGRRFYPAYGR